MAMNNNFNEADIRKLIDEYQSSGYTLKDFCVVAEVDEAQMQGWLDQYSSEQSGDDNPFFIGNIKEGMTGPVRDAAPKSAPKKPQPLQTPVLFARVCDIEIYKEVPAAYLRSLKA